MSDALTELGFNDFVIRINHRQLLTAMLARRCVPAEHHGDALVALDKLDKIGVDGVEKELAQARNRRRQRAASDAHEQSTATGPSWIDAAASTNVP